MLWSVCLLVCTLAIARAVVVTTRDGALRGITTTMDNHVIIDTFYNIPYAKPPIGDLRFQKPQRSEPWTGTRDATAPGPECPQHPFSIGVANPQVIVHGQEDCLYLNVYAPRTHGGNALPVMVWIHGGAFYMGSAVSYDGKQLASNGVVVVTINYRLGALGFLSTQDGASPGNYGMYDQVLALKWVRDIISAFHGDPNDVTIFGESAGSASVSLLIESRETTGLFHKAIMESGASLSPFALCTTRTQPQPAVIATTLASRLGCPVDDHSGMLTCLKTKSVDSIVKTQGQMEVENGMRMNFRPVVEMTFGQSGLLPATPEVILTNGWSNNVTVLRGFNKDENSQNPYMTDTGLTLEMFRNFTINFVTIVVMKEYPTLNLDRTVDLLVNTYVTQPGITDPQQLRDVFLKMNSDFDFYAPTLKEMDMYGKNRGPTQYLYRFSYRAANRLIPIWMGVPHADDLMYVFGYPLSNLTLIPHFVSTWTDDDKHVAQQMMTWWTNFAKYGNPTPSGSSGTPLLSWTPTTTSRFLDINTQSVMVNTEEAILHPHLVLWNDVIPKMAAEQPIIG